MNEYTAIHVKRSATKRKTFLQTQVKSYFCLSQIVVAILAVVVVVDVLDDNDDDGDYYFESVDGFYLD